MVRIRFYDPDSDEDPRTTGERAKQPNATELVGRGPGIDWVGQLSWSENPFIPFAARPAQLYFIGHDNARKAISDFLARGEHLATVTGVLGIGKTIFLAWLTEELAKHPRDYRVVNATAREGPEALTKKLLEPYQGFFSHYSGETNEELVEYLTSKEKKRRIVLLIDDAENLGESEALINALLDAPRISVVLAGESVPKLAAKPLHIPLTPITPLHAEELLEARIRGVGGRGLKPFTSKTVAELWKAAQGDPTRFFRYAEETAMRAAMGQLTLGDTSDATEDDAESETGEDVSTARAKRKRSDLDALIHTLVKDDENNEK